MAISAGVRHGRVIVDCELAIREHLDLEKVVPAMIDKKLFPKKVGKAFLKKKDESGTKALFVDCLKKLTLEQFGEFLTIVKSVEEERDSERSIMKLLSSSLKMMKLQPGSNVHRVVSDFIAAADKMETSTQEHTRTTVRSMQTKIEESSCPATNIAQDTRVQSSEIRSVGEAAKVSSKPFKVSSDQSTSQIAATTRPHGFQSGCRTRSFTREGGLLYSPEHGVTVIIPPAAVPSSVEKFVLGVYVYLSGPFSLPKNVQPCSPVVWFHLHPRFTFEADVTVKIPHCAAISQQLRTGEPSTASSEDEGSLYVLTIEEEKENEESHYDLSRCIEADFNDGYHAVFAVRHFSPHTVVESQPRCKSPLRNRLGSSESAGVKKKKSTQDSSSAANRLPCKSVTTKDLTKKGSLQDEEDELYQVTQGRSNSEERRVKQVDLKFCMARCMPMERSCGSWTVDFIISHFHPTGVHAIDHYAKQLHGNSVDISSKKKFVFVEEDICFEPESFTSPAGCWTVAATENNVMSMDEVLMQLPSPPASQQVCNPPRLTYSVEAVSLPSHLASTTEHLDCKIEVKGAVGAKGVTPYFKVYSKSTSPTHTSKGGDRRTLHTISYLYSPGSEILTAVAHSSRHFTLNLQDPEHVKFLMDISLQLTVVQSCHTHLLAQAFHLELYQLEEILQNSLDDTPWQMYGVLRAWLATCVRCSRDGATLGALKDALSNIKVDDIKLSDFSDQSNRQGISLAPSELDTIPVQEGWSGDSASDGFLLKLSEKLQCCWRKVGSLMGIPKSTLDVVAQENNQLHEQAYQMLLRWQREGGRTATYGVVFAAIQRLHQHNPDIVNDAWVYCVHYLELNGGGILPATAVSQRPIRTLNDQSEPSNHSP